MKEKLKKIKQHLDGKFGNPEFEKLKSDNFENKQRLAEIKKQKERQISYNELEDKPKILDKNQIDEIAKQYRHKCDKNESLENLKNQFKGINKKILWFSEILKKVNEYIKQLKIKHSDLLGITPNDHHKEKHTIESHDTNAKGKQLTQLTKGGDDNFVDHLHKHRFPPIVFPTAITDHGALTGLTDDDHTQYIKVDGTRAFTGNQSLGDNNITNVGDISLNSISDDAGVENTLTIGNLNTAYDHTSLTNDPHNITWAQVDKATSDIADITTKSHASLSDIGTNTHTQLDDHLADNTQAHSDYLKNDADDTTSGKLTASSGFDAGSGDVEFDLGGANVYPLTNKSGATTTIGYVYRLDPDNDSSFDYGSEDEDRQVVVAMEAIADASATRVHIGAGIVDVYVTGDTTRGQCIYFSSTNGQAKPSWMRKDGAFAQAIADRTGAGLVKAYIFLTERIERRNLWRSDSNNKHIDVPFGKPTDYASNPIIQKDTGWNSDHIAFPDVFYDPTTNNIYMLTGGHNGTGWENIGIYKATSFPNTWAEIDSNPIITIGSAGADDEARVELARIFYDPEETDSDKRFKIFFTGRNDAGAKVAKWATAPSVEGTWTKQGTISGLTNFVAGTSFFRVGNVNFLIFRDTAPALKVAYNLDPTVYDSFTTLGTILSPSASGWDDLDTNYFYLFYSQGVWYMLYSGRGSSGWQIGQATSTDPDWGTVFTKLFANAGNPIIPSGSGWKANTLLFPSVFADSDGVLYVFYCARDSSNIYSIGYATYLKSP